MTEKELMHEAAVALGRKGGKAKSARKAQACRQNSKRAGRPPKHGWAGYRVELGCFICTHERYGNVLIVPRSSGSMAFRVEPGADVNAWKEPVKYCSAVVPKGYTPLKWTEPTIQMVLRQI